MRVCVCVCVWILTLYEALKAKVLQYYSVYSYIMCVCNIYTMAISGVCVFHTPEIAIV